jgi:UDP-N-acetylmuramoyl-tripeptide--D-alanyl-D-alanine ligase
MNLDTSQIAQALPGASHIGTSTRITRVGTDSRKVAPGELFVALVGERFDAHDFVAQAQRSGAAAAMVARALPIDLPQIVVPDTLLGLGSLAKLWRDSHALPVIAITGSNGKTTVKEMLAAILVAHSGNPEAVLATEGNLNNAIGVPLMMLRLTALHGYLVLEMGMNHLREIDYLTRLATPDVALVNNAHRAHIGELGSQDKIAEAKGEIYAGLAPDGTAIINADDRYADYWRSLNIGRRLLTFGQSERADLRGVQQPDGSLKLHYRGEVAATQLAVPGEHNVKNALAATAAAVSVGVPLLVAAMGLAQFQGVKGRLQHRQGLRGARLIDDTYNANPDSAKAAIRVLTGYSGRTVLIMGDMGELGAFSREAHAEVGRFARKSGVQSVFTLGHASREVAQGFGDGEHFHDLEPLVAAVLRELDSDVTVLIKGSRSMQMERVVEKLAAART